MRKFLIKFVMIAVGICFAGSATEVNAFGIHNTFFDQYDTYVQSEEIDAQVDFGVEKEKKNHKPTYQYRVLLAYSFISKKWANKQFYYSSIYHCSPSSFTRKIFLRNSVWII